MKPSERAHQGHRTRIASRSASDCSTALASTETCESAAAVSSTAVFKVSVAEPFYEPIDAIRRTRQLRSNQIRYTIDFASHLCDA